MLKVLMFVNWPIYNVEKFSDDIRNPDQVVRGERYWFSKYWPNGATIDVIGISRSSIVYPLEKPSRIHLQFAKAFRKIKDYDLLLTYDSPSAFLFSLLRSKFGFYRSIPHIMVDIALPRAAERFFNVPPSLMCKILKQTFNSKSVSHMIFHSSCQRSFYRDGLGFSDDALSYVPFGVETEYFKPESLEGEDYIFAAGEFRDFETLLRAYEKYHEDLPELRIRSGLPKPNYLPPKVNWLPRAPISTFKMEALKSKFVIVPLHYTLRSVGLITCLQFMALGKAVVTSNVPPIDGYIVDGKTALCYRPYDQKDLFTKISLLLKEDKLVDELGKKARIDVEARFTVKNMGMQFWNRVSDVLKSAHNEPKRAVFCTKT